MAAKASPSRAHVPPQAPLMTQPTGALARRAAVVVLVVIGIAAGLEFLWMVRQIVLWLVIGSIFAMALEPGGLLLGRDRAKAVDADEVAEAGAPSGLRAQLARHPGGVPHGAELLGIFFQHQAGERGALNEHGQLELVVGHQQRGAVFEEHLAGAGRRQQKGEREQAHGSMVA